MLREIISLQLGHYANHVGAHWWNIQQSYFCHHPSQLNEIWHDILFREGQTLQGEVTFTPRLVAVDVSGSVTPLQATGACLYGDEQTDASASWCHQTEVFKEEPACSLHQPARSEAAALQEDDAGAADSDADVDWSDAKCSDGDFSVWCGYLRAHLHPRSLLLTPQYQINNTSRAFDLFSYGVEQYGRDEFGDAVEDRIRQFAEECDALSGFHVLYDVDSGFGGVSACTLSHLNDEYPRRPVLSIPLYDYSLYNDIPQAVHAAVNCLLSLDCDVSQSTLCLPLSVAEQWPSPLAFTHGLSQRLFPHIRYKPELRYHSSAIIAATLDSITLPWRLRADSLCRPVVADWSADSLEGVASRVTARGPLATGGSALPVLDEAAARSHCVAFQCLTPGAGTQPGEPSQGATVVLRGVPDSWKLDETGRCSVLSAPSSLRLSPPYPAIVDSAGCAPTADKRGVPAAALLGGSVTAAASSISSLTGIVAPLRADKLHRFLAAGLQPDELSEALERLLTLSEQYTDQ